MTVMSIGQVADRANCPTFEVERLSLAYPDRRGQMSVILKNVSFTVERGSALTLVGPSGSGKSTLLRCLNRLEEPTAGTVRFEGWDIHSLDPRRLRRGAALVMQMPVLFDGTVRDNLRFRPADVDVDLSEAVVAGTLAEVDWSQSYWTATPPHFPAAKGSG